MNSVRTWFRGMSMSILMLCSIVLGQQTSFVKQQTGFLLAGNGNVVLAAPPNGGVPDTVATLPNGDGASVLSVSEDGKTLFVGSYSGAVYRIAVTLRSGSVTGSAQLLSPGPYGANITGVAYDTKRGLLYACGQNLVFRIDTRRTPWKVTQWGTLSGPAQIITTCLAVNDNGLYVGNGTAANQFGGQVNQLSITTPNRVLRTASLQGVQELVLGPNGNVIVLGPSQVHLFTPNLRSLSSVPVAGGTPNGVALSGDGMTAYIATFTMDQMGYQWARLIRVGVAPTALVVRDTLMIGSRIPLGVSVWDELRTVYLGQAPTTTTDSRNNVVKLIDIHGASMMVRDSVVLPAGPSFVQAILARKGYEETAVGFNGNTYSLALNSGTGKLFVATSEYPSKLSVVNIATGAVDTSVMMPSTMPYSMAIDTVRNILYCVGMYADAVYAIDAATYRVLDTIPTGNSPAVIAVNPTTRKLYVGNTQGQSMTVIDAAAGTVDTTIAMGSWPNGIAVNSVTNTVYWLDLTHTSLTVMSGRTLAVDTSINVLTTPTCLAVDPVANKVYVGQYNRTDGLGGYFRPDQPMYSVSVIDGARNHLDTTLIMMDYPTSMAVDPLAPALYVANDQLISRYEPATKRMGTIALSPSMNPFDLAVDPRTKTLFGVTRSGSTLLIVKQ